MRDLAAQVTSSLLRFPEVTLDALGEDEITLDSVLHGSFTIGRSGLAWLACGPQLEVVNAVTGERFSAYRFSSVSEHPPRVLVARYFSWLKRTGLLVGLEEAEGSLLCLYDLSISRVVKAVVIPGRVTAIEPLVSYGGANANTQHLHQSLRWFFGVAAVVTDLGHVLLLDLCLDDLSCSQSELEASDLEVVNKSPAEIPRLRESVTQQGRHLCLQLSSPTGTGATALQYITRTNQLAVGFSDGYLQLWNMKTLKKEYHSQLEGGRVPVFAFTFQEPENDPRNCCYMWAVQSAQEYEGDVVSLHLLQLAFGERKCLASGKILYEGLEYCEERYSQDLNGASLPLRAQATNTRLLGCQTIEKFRHHTERDDAVSEVASPDTSVSIFSWQVKSYGQGKPSVYIGIFDINRWYHAQMPDSLRAGESLHNCPYLAVWCLDAVVEMTSPSLLLDVIVHERSLSRGLPPTCPPPEQFFNPTTYNFDVTCLLHSGVVHLTCSGYQKETLSFLRRSAPCLSEALPDTYTRCLMSGLLSSRLTDIQPSNLSQEQQLDAILCTAVETSSLGLITGCLRQWTAENQPQSAANLRYILEWAWVKVVSTKKELDGICVPLFDSSSNFIDSQTLQLLQHNQRLLANLSTIFHCLLNEAQELTQKGMLGLLNKWMVSGLLAQYAQVVLWFCRTGLLPEGVDDGIMQLSRPYYNYPVIKNYYTGRREELQRLSRGKWSADCLMIDGLVAQFGERLVDLWKRDDEGTRQYPPPTLHALLDIYLLDNIEESAKHAIVIYMLLDVMYSYPSKNGASVESFPTAFAIPISLVKLVQGLWLLDHHDHENSLELLLHPTTSRSLWDWQHERVLEALMCQGQHNLALRYLHTIKPHMTSASQVKVCLTVLLHNRCMVEAWALLRQHCSKLNSEEMLRFMYQTCQELGLMKDLLKLPLGFSEQETLEKFLQECGGPQNKELLVVHYLQQANYVPALQLNQTLKMNLVNDRDPKMKERSNTRNSILDHYGKVLPRVQRRLAMERAKPYHHPSTICREVSRPQPLSTVAKRSAAGNVLTRAAFINNVLSKIGEVWKGKDGTPESSPLKSSPKVPELPLPSPHHPSVDLPEAFVCTPISLTNKRCSRVLDLVVQPFMHTTPQVSSLPQTPPKTAVVGFGSTPPTRKSMYVKSISKAPELSLLQTPQVVKRARALAAAGPMFPSFTPQSILRSSLRPTPVATPSASPGRSASPNLRSKESCIAFIEETVSLEPTKGQVHWSSTIAEDEVSEVLRSSAPPASDPNEEEQQEDTFNSLAEEYPVAERAISLTVPQSSKAESFLVRNQMVVSPVLLRPSLGAETSLASVQSGNTTVEFHDAPEDLIGEPLQVLNDDDDDKVVVNLRPYGEHVTLAESSQLNLKDDFPEVPSQDLPDEVSMALELREEHTKDTCAADHTVEEPGLQEELPEELEMVEPPSHQIDQLEVDEQKAELLEHTGLDEFVERHLFGDDRSPSLTRSSIRDSSEISVSFNSSKSFCHDEADEAVPVICNQVFASHTPTATYDAVAELHADSHMSSSVTSEESRASAQDNSGSDVEIIEEVQGNVTEQILGNVNNEALQASVYLEQQAAVFSILEAERDTEGTSIGKDLVVMLDLKTPDQKDENEAVFAELKQLTIPSTPMDRCEEQPLIDEAVFEFRENFEPEEPPIDAPSNFSLMLEAEDGDSGQTKPMMGTENILLLESSEEINMVMGPQAQQKLKQPDLQDFASVIALTETDQITVGELPNEVCQPFLEEAGIGDPALHEDLKEDQSMPLQDISGTSERVDEAEELLMVEPFQLAEKFEVESILTQVEVVNDLGIGESVGPVVDNTNKGEIAIESVLEVNKSISKAPQVIVDSVENTKDSLSTTQSRATRQRKTVTFPSTTSGENGVQSEEEKIQEQGDSQVPSTPRRSTRISKHNKDCQVPLIPKRTTRSTVEISQAQKEEVNIYEQTSLNLKSKRVMSKTPQKTTPRKSSQCSRNTVVEEEVIEQSHKKVIVPAVVTYVRTPRKSIAPILELDAKAPSSPSRVTRKSSRITLALETSQFNFEETAAAAELFTTNPKRNAKKVKVIQRNVQDSSEKTLDLNISRRSTRSQLLNVLDSREKKERPLLETTLEVEPGMQLADALLERLSAKGHKEGEEGNIESVTEIVRARRRVTKSTLVRDPSLPPTLSSDAENQEALPTDKHATAGLPRDQPQPEEPKSRKAQRKTTNKIAKQDSSPERAFVFSLPKSRRKIKGSKADSPVDADMSQPQFVFSPPVTRTRQKTNAAVQPTDEEEDKVTEDNVSETEKAETKVAKPRRKQAKVKAHASVPPPVEINLISPLPSPAEPVVPQLRRRREEATAPPQRMTLRRKRLMETVFPKPVTRRKML